jgi:phosphoribosylglycinamide formyltransferase-1
MKSEVAHQVFYIAVLVSGGGTNLQSLIDQIQDGRLENVAISCVIASRADCFAIRRAEEAGIPVRIVSRKDFNNPVDYDTGLLEALRPFPVDLVVLAGFLSLLGPRVIQAYQHRIINIHPSLIPSFCGPGFFGIKPHEAALSYGVRITGATVHVVDTEYDHGPIILQKAVYVRPDDTPQTLQKRVMIEAEQQLLPEAVALFAAGRIEIKNGHATIRKGEMEK